MEARELLELAAEYVRAQDGEAIGGSLGVEPQQTPDDVAARFSAGLDEYVTRAVRRAVERV